MSHIKNTPLVIVGMLLLIIGWFSIFSGFFGLGRGAEDTIVITFQLESMLVDKTFVPASHFIFHMVLRIILGFLFVFIGNAFLVRGLYTRHAWMHPEFNDLRRLG